MAVRCYRCGKKFSVGGLTLEMVTGVVVAIPCPSCGAKPVLTPSGGDEAGQLHGIIDVRDTWQKQSVTWN